MNNDFTTLALDNILIAAAPGSVVVEPEPTEEPEEEEPEETEPAEQTPDLSVTTITAPARSQYNTPLSIEAEVVNTNARTRTHALTLYRHTEATATPTEGGTAMATVGVFLQTNQTKTVQMNTTTPPFPGTYYLYACISTLDDEDNTENNCKLTTLVVQTEEVTEEPAAQPVLTVGFALSPPRTVAPSATITFYARVRNIGDADATNSRIRLFRHPERTGTPRIGGTQVATTPLSPAPRANTLRYPNPAKQSTDNTGHLLLLPVC